MKFYNSETTSQIGRRKCQPNHDRTVFDVFPIFRIKIGRQGFHCIDHKLRRRGGFIGKLTVVESQIVKARHIVVCVGFLGVDHSDLKRDESSVF
jgi:hypothetical protein